VIAPWMLYTVVVGACAAAAALAVEPLVVARGGARRGGWLVALVVAFLGPVAVAIRPVALPGALPTAVGASRVASGDVTPILVPAGADWERWLVVVWMAASLAMWLALAVSAFQLWRAGRRATAVVLDGARVALTPDTGPGALCFGDTRIVMPAWLATLDVSRRALLVRHEDEHVRAGDPYLLLASLGALALMPWNPSLWFIAQRLRTALELDCDARVLASGADVRTYGELLLTVAATRRPPRLAAYLAFAASPSPLERRIRAMTSLRPDLGTMRQLLLAVVALSAVVTACETRRPDPVAPVTSFTVADGQVTAASTPTGAQADSIKVRLSTEVRERVPAPTLSGNVNDPLVMVYDAEGRVVMTGRLGARSSTGQLMLDSLPVPADAIATVEVIKDGSFLPAEAKGGVIRLTLKADRSMKRSPAPASAGAGVSVRERSETAAPPRTLVAIVMNSEGKELLREEITAQGGRGAGERLDQLVDPAAIASVNVIKVPAGAAAPRDEVHIVLKPGQGLKARR
jgi:hypothetical protein